MYLISYCLIFTFHPELKTDKLVITRNFSHTLEQLTDLSYLNDLYAQK